MNIVASVNSDAAGLGAKWMHVEFTNEHIDIIKSMLRTMISGGKWKHVDEIVLASGFCEITVFDRWPYKVSPPNDVFYITESNLEFYLTEAQLNKSIIQTEYNRVSITAYGQVHFMADYKHAVTWEGVIASHMIDIDDIKVR